MGLLGDLGRELHLLRGPSWAPLCPGSAPWSAPVLAPTLAELPHLGQSIFLPGSWGRPARQGFRSKRPAAGSWHTTKPLETQALSLLRSPLGLCPPLLPWARLEVTQLPGESQSPGTGPGARRPAQEGSNGGSRPTGTGCCSWWPSGQLGDLKLNPHLPQMQEPPGSQTSPSASPARPLPPPPSLISQRDRNTPLFNKTVRTTDLCNAHGSLSPPFFPDSINAEVAPRRQTSDGKHQLHVRQRSLFEQDALRPQRPLCSGEKPHQKRAGSCSGRGKQSWARTGGSRGAPGVGGRSCGGWVQSGKAPGRRRRQNCIWKHEQEFAHGKGGRGDSTPKESEGAGLCAEEEELREGTWVTERVASGGVRLSQSLRLDRA